MTKYLLLLLVGFAPILSNAQPPAGSRVYSRQDSLRGSVTPERAWWDLKRYELSVSFDPARKSISGSNTVTYDVLQPNTILQIDLQAPLIIDRVTQDGQELQVQHDGDAHFIQLKKHQIEGEINQLTIEYHGQPHVALHAPWDGGITWSKDLQGKDFIATSCQGIGASTWWPCKDHMYDEPDEGMTIHINIPEGLIAVSNGRLIEQKKQENKTTTFTWRVVNPINNYGVNVNIGDYVHFSETYPGEKGSLDMDYWVTRPNLEKAREQFKDAAKTMKAFEYWFGPYPFYNDGYKLVEVPYLGMEHQSSVTYGNGFANGYRGRDLSNTGWGLKWDFIIVHESGHEWFANNITYRDIADMWIHEGFAAYGESLFTEYYFGKEAGAEYVRGIRALIDNRKPIIGEYGVNSRGSGDMYYKGSNLLHTLRQVVNDDKKWRQTLRGLNEEFYHRTVNTEQIENYMAKSVGINLDAFFDQYLRDIRIPVLEYWVSGETLHYRWTNCIDSFDMPVKVYIDEMPVVLYPSTTSKTLPLEKAVDTVKLDPDFYAYSSKIMDSK